jgi:hypothetical protein
LVNLNRAISGTIYLMEILSRPRVDQAAARLLTECTQIKELHLNQFKVFGKTNRIISSPHKELIIKELSENTKK